MCFLQIPSATVLNHLLIFSIGLPFLFHRRVLDCLHLHAADLPCNILRAGGPRRRPRYKLTICLAVKLLQVRKPCWLASDLLYFCPCSSLLSAFGYVIYTYKQYWTCSPNLILFTSCYYCFLFHVVCKIRGYNLPCNFYSKCNITFSVHAYFFCQVLFYIHYFNVLTKCGIRLLNNHLWYFQAK